MGKRTEITIEKHEITVVRSGSHKLLADAPRRIWCPLCEQETVMLTAETAAQAAGVSRREIYRRIERGELNCTETAEGVVYICWQKPTA